MTIDLNFDNAEYFRFVLPFSRIPKSVKYSLIWKKGESTYVQVTKGGYSYLITKTYATFIPTDKWNETYDEFRGEK